MQNLEFNVFCEIIYGSHNKYYFGYFEPHLILNKELKWECTFNFISYVSEDEENIFVSPNYYDEPVLENKPHFGYKKTSLLLDKIKSFELIQNHMNGLTFSTDFERVTLKKMLWAIEDGQNVAC